MSKEHQSEKEYLKPTRETQQRKNRETEGENDKENILENLRPAEIRKRYVKTCWKGRESTAEAAHQKIGGRIGGWGVFGK